MVAEKQYTTQLGAGLGMIPETLEFLRHWAPGMSASTLADRVIADGVLPRVTARRARNLAVEMFGPRFLVANGEPAARLRVLAERRLHQDALSQLFLLQTARAQRIFADFVIEVYWPRYSGGASVLTRKDAESFIHRALDSGRMAKRWADSMIRRVSGYLLGCCTDFGLLGPGVASRPIRRFAIRPEVVLYLTHDLHFSGFSDRNLISHEDWRLFGLEPDDTLRLVSNLSHEGHLLVQSGADLVQISWKYRTMEECIHALAKG